MSKISAIEKLRREIATDLRRFSSILQNQQICADTSPFFSAASECLSSVDNFWGYDLTELVIRLGKIKKVFPTSNAQLTCRVNCSVKSSIRKYPQTSDPYDYLSLNISFEAYSESGAKKFFQAWHLDREFGINGNQGCDETHPRYHMHFGGKEMTSFANTLRCASKCHNFGQLLLLSSPRLIHPPLDAILAVDFILANLQGAKWKILRNDPDYSRIVGKSQERSWKPFVNALNEHWTPGHSIPDRWLTKDAFPQII